MVLVMIRSRLRNELQDLLELVLFPALCVVLPWPLCFKAFRWMSRRFEFLYRSAVDAAYKQTALVNSIHVEPTWKADRRLVTLVDHADLYLSHTRGQRWFSKYVDVVGNWPDANKKALVLTFHWGAGMWALHFANAQGVTAPMLVNAAHKSQFEGRGVCYCYVKVRIRRIGQLLSQPTLDAITDARGVVKALRQDKNVLAVIDVPADGLKGAQPVTLLGMQAVVPKALLRHAVEQGIPVTVFLTGINMQNGRRTLAVHLLGLHTDIEVLTQVVFDHLNAAIQQHSPSWHLWSECPRFFPAQVQTS